MYINIKIKYKKIRKKINAYKKLIYINFPDFTN